MRAKARFDLSLLRDDLDAKGWLPVDLARAAGVSSMSVSRFLRGDQQTARMAKKLAKALGRSVRRYLVAPQPHTHERSRKRPLRGSRQEAVA